jgi:hypothetical protein
MRLPADTREIERGLKERLQGVEQEPVRPDMEDLLLELDRVTQSRIRA